MPIKPRGNGLEVSVQLTLHGKKNRHREIVHCSMEEAQAREAQVRAWLMAGKEVEPFKLHEVSRGITLKEALDVTYERYWANGSMARTILSNIKDCLEYFGPNTPIDKITTDDADAFLSHFIGKGLAASTVRSKASTMTKMFNHFHRRGNIQSKPYFDLPKIGDNTRDRVLTKEEENELLRLLEEDYDRVVERKGHAGQHYADMVAFLLDTGCRPSEARHVEARNYGDGRVTLKVTKSGLSRTLPLTARAEETLERHIILHGDKPFAWCTKPMLRHAWNWARSNMGLDDDEGFIPYALRHTCATRLYDKTRDIMVVQKWLGHKTIQMTLRYAKLQPHDLDRARDLLEAA